MRGLVVGLVLASGAACLDFDARVDAGCAQGAKWPECDAGATEDGGGERAWRWEYPTPLGGADLLGIWESRGEIWVAGAGPTLARRAGGTWVDEARRLPALPTGVGEPMPAITAVTVTDAGDVWLLGTRLGLVGLLADGGSRHLTDLGLDHVAAASDYGVTVFLRSDPPSLDYLEADGSRRTVPLQLPEAEGYFYVGLSPGEAWVSYDVGDTSWLRGSRSSSPVSLEVDGGSCGRVSAFARVGDRLAVSCSGNGHAFVLGDAGTWSELPLPETRGAVITHRLHSLADGGVVWWLSGGGGFVRRIDADGQSAELTTEYFPDSYASWLSPEGTFWLAGGGGRVASVELTPGAAPVVERGAQPQPQTDIRDLAVRGNEVFAGGHSGWTWARDAASGSWTRSRSGFTTFNAVAIRPNGERCLLDESATLSCGGRAVRSFDALRPDAGPNVPFDRRGGGLDIADDGTFRLAVGAVAAMQLADAGTWSIGPLTGDRDQAAQVIATPAGMWVASNYSTTPYAVTNGAVQFVGFEGSRAPCVFDAAVFGIAAIDGGVLVAGRDFVATCIDSQASTVDVPPEEDWVSVWVDASGAWWLVSNTGQVLRRAPGSAGWLREAAPLGPTPWAGPTATRILGNERDVYIVGAGGGILRRPLP